MPANCAPSLLRAFLDATVESGAEVLVTLTNTQTVTFDELTDFDNCTLIGLIDEDDYEASSVDLSIVQTIQVADEDPAFV